MPFRPLKTETTKEQPEVKGGFRSLGPVVKPKKETNTVDKVLGASEKATDFIGAKGVTDLYGSLLARLITPRKAQKYINVPTPREVAGSALQLGSLGFPMGAGASLATKIGVGAASGYALDVGSKLQDSDKSLPEVAMPSVGTAVGAGLPVAGVAIRPVKALVGRIFQGLGTALSGVSSKSIDEIIENPEVARQVSKQLKDVGSDVILEQNTKAIVNGVAKIKQEARRAYGEGLDQLAKTDIQPKVFRQQTQSFLDKYGVTGTKGNRILENVEFEDPKNIKKANELIDRLHNAELDGKSLRKLADDVENSIYKTATSDERLSFNAFIKDFSSSLKEAINKSTGKLDEINKQFSQDLQLAETIEDVFGDVNFRNLPELVKASQKLENIFNQKGLAPKVVDDFLNKIGASDLKTSEAVRQISEKASGANAKGLNLAELTQQVTSSVITPKLVRDIAVVTGLSEKSLVPFLEKMKPAARAILINALLQSNGQGSE